MKSKAVCDWCGKEFFRDECRLRGKQHHFCCRQCLADFSNKSKNPDGYAELKDYTNMGKHLSELNRQLNPTRMTDSTRRKLHDAHMNSGEGRTYSKLYGRHTHRVIAERKIGRKLQPGEVVHHIDGNKRNNDPRNLMVFKSQSEHAKFHAELKWFLEQLEAMEGGDAQ